MLYEMGRVGSVCGDNNSISAIGLYLVLRSDSGPHGQGMVTWSVTTLLIYCIDMIGCIHNITIIDIIKYRGFQLCCIDLLLKE